MKIGIPTTLFWSYHASYWRKFLQLPGLETVFSEVSSEATALTGSRLLPHEFCLPMKVFMGHVVNLMEQKVDLILTPVMTSKDRRNFACPKLIGLTDIIKYSAGLSEKSLFAPVINCQGVHIKMLSPPKQRIVAPAQLKTREAQANRHWEQTLRQCREARLTLPETLTGPQFPPQAGGLTMGVLGYAYTLYDPWISKGIMNRLNALGVSAITWEMLEPDRIAQCLQSFQPMLYWNFGKIILGAGLHFLAAPNLDGVIYVSTFGCGPDSVITKLLSIEAERRRKPLLTVNLDEHSECVHLQTRLEAFTDMLSERKETARRRVGS
jgi:predicted nucleotide-binding protein (sugar kinase/HSP70/actin superfamily)